MNRYRRVWVVYCKELLETLRDKRTLAAMILVPIVLYPVLMIIIMEALRAETGRRQAERYSVCVPDVAHEAWLNGVLEREEAEQNGKAAEAIRMTPRRTDGIQTAEFLSARLRSDQVAIYVAQPGESLWDLVADQHVHVAMIVEPPPKPDATADPKNRRLLVIHNDTNPRSEFVYSQLRSIMFNESERIVRDRLARMPGGVATLTPLMTTNLSTSSPDQQFAKILAMVVPFLLVIMTVTGALYPSIDLTAGERERGTLETLAVSPVPVGLIVAGKFGVVVTIAMFSTALNLGSMTAVFHFSKLAQLAVGMGASDTAEALSAPRLNDLNDDSAEVLTQRDYLERRMRLESDARQRSGFIITAAPLVLLAMLPFAVLAGGVMLATCSFARTFKEAQNYMMPVMMVFMIPAMVVSYMPTTRLEGVLLVLPVANIVVLIRELFLGNYQPAAMGICLLSTCFYAAVAMTVAARLYGNEAVLFSDVGSYKTLIQRRFFQPQTFASPATALAVVAVIFPFYFYWQSYLVDLGDSPGRIRLVIAGAQVLVLAAPTLLLAWYLKLNLRETFVLRPPRAMPMAGSVLLALSVVPMANLLRSVQFHWFPPGRDLFGEHLMVLQEGSILSILLVLALVPAVCEELVFRGFLLTGLRHRLSAFASVIIVGLIFGLFHMYMEKIPVLALLGALLAIVCLRSGSIYPAMLIHLANNGLALAAARHEGLAHWLAMPRTHEELVTPRFDALVAMHAAIFLVGLALVLWPREKAARTV